MKIGIITFHFVNNFGGVLQGYALQKKISECCDVDCVMVDYRNWFIRFTDTVRIFPITTNLQEFISGLRTLKARFGRIRQFKKFMREDYVLTRFYGSRWSMNLIPPKCDKFVCGSDQIWNPVITMGVAPNYFLRFVEKSKDKIAYAPSFGTDGISRIWKKKIKKYIESFDYLSVREKSGKQMIFEMTGREAEQLIDPTFLLEKHEWEKFAVSSNIKGKYILLYIMQRDEEVYEYARKIKEKMGIQLVEISRYGYKPDFVDECLVDVGPKEFLGLFRDAEYVCTNSYHGLAYSLIFEIEFCLIPCKRFKARIENLLELLHIESCVDGEDWNSLTASYDKEYVRKIIEEERKKAITYLQNSITG